VIGQNGSTVDARAVDKQRDRDLDEQTSKVAILREMRNRAGGSNDPGGKWHRSLSLSLSLSLCLSLSLSLSRLFAFSQFLAERHRGVITTEFTAN